MFIKKDRYFLCKRNNSNRKVVFTLAEVFSPQFASCRKSAFTLAEVLITLGIIGVVAAMTLPTLITNHEKKVTANKVKKVYTQLSQAVKMAEVNEGSLDNWDYDLDPDAFAEKYIKPYYKVIKSCSMTTDITSCFSITTPLGESTGGFYEYRAALQRTAFITSDGTSFMLKAASKSVRWARAVAILVDINGLKKPNMAGKDVFVFWIAAPQNTIYFNRGEGDIAMFDDPQQYGLFPDGYGFSRTQLLSGQGNLYRGCRKGQLYTTSGAYCTALILMDGEIKDDYPW